MSRKDAVVLASRTLAVLLTVWALSEVSYLPSSVYSFLHHANRVSVLSDEDQYWRHYYLTSLGFLITRIVGYTLTARWLFKCGPEVAEFLLPANEESAAQN
jgi:hypothetical protein